MDLDRAHKIARDRGPIPIVYWIARAILQACFRVYFRMNRVGTENIRRGWRIRPRRVTVRCGRALTFPRPLDREPRHGLAQEIANRVWSCISLQWEYLGGLAPIRRVVVIGAGSWGTAVATLLARGGASVQLACRTLQQAHELASLRANLAYLPGVSLPEGVAVTTVARLDWSDV